MKVVEVTQFFNYKNMTWNELIKCDKKGVLPSVDNTVFLWSEIPKIKIVTDDEHPTIGDVWLKEGINNGIEVFKANYDSSD